MLFHCEFNKDVAACLYFLVISALQQTYLFREGTTDMYRNKALNIQKNSTKKIYIDFF